MGGKSRRGEMVAWRRDTSHAGHRATRSLVLGTFANVGARSTKNHLGRSYRQRARAHGLGFSLSPHGAHVAGQIRVDISRQGMKNLRIYHESHLPLRLCAFARGNLYSLAPLTADASLPIHSSRLRVFSRKGAKAQSFSESSNTDFWQNGILAIAISISCRLRRIHDCH